MSNLTPNKILNNILKNPAFPKSYTYIITGKSGTTGKTWLTEQLKANGYKAIDISNINPYYNDNNDPNSVHRYLDDKVVVIVLNETLNPLRIPNKLPSHRIMLVPVESLNDIKNGDWLYDLEMIEKREHERSLDKYMILEQCGFVMCEIVDYNSANCDKSLFISSCGEEGSYWVGFEPGRFFKVVFE